MSFTLKHLPCPAGTKCTAFQCIFGHGADETNSAPSPATEQRERKPSDTAASGRQDGPRKRLKAEKGQGDVSDTSSAEFADVAPGSSSQDIAIKHSSLKSIARPVTPPPVTRKESSPQLPRKASHATRTTDSSSSRAAPLTNAKPLPHERAKLKPTKPETLNPRLLKSAPASHEVRLKLLKLLHAEYRRLNTELKKDTGAVKETPILSEQELIKRALDEEQTMAVEKAPVYSNVMKNLVTQYKRMSVRQWKSEVDAKCKAQSGEQNDTAEEPKTVQTGLTSEQEVELLDRLLTPIDGLSEHGYVPKVPDDTAIGKAREGTLAARGWEVCDRCKQRFQVFPGRREEDGALTSGGTCTFHWGKTFIAPKQPGDRTRQPKRYQCCGQEVGDSSGCHSRDHHVFKVSNPQRLATLLNFEATPKNDHPPSDRAVCFDCEMGYTVHGFELIRLTATAWPAGDVLLDTLVHPFGEILDLNSRYSGVWPNDLSDAEPWTDADDTQLDEIAKGVKSIKSSTLKSEKPKRLKVVSSPRIARQLLLKLISPSTPLIGHGLENDLNAVRIVHPTLIDTVLLFPHKGGLPFRHGLKMLMDAKLNRKIQQELGPNVTGHDSAEDARAAGELVRLKVMDLWKDMQRAGWRIEDGKMVSPDSKVEKDGNHLTERFLES